MHGDKYFLKFIFH